MEAIRKEWLTPEEVANMLNLSMAQVKILIKSGRIPSIRLSRKISRINADALNAFIVQSSSGG